MAKTTKKAAAAAVPDDVIEVTEITVVPKEIESQALALVNPFQAKLAELKETYGNVEITDKASLEFAQKGLNYMVGLRNQAEKTRLNMFRPVLKLNSDVKAMVDNFAEEVKAIEQPIKDKINAEEKRQQEEAKKEHLRRIAMLEEFGWQLAGQFYRVGPHQILFDQVDAATEEQLEKWAKMGADWLEAERVRKEQEEARLKEIQEREAKLAAEEAELAEFRAWKAAKAAAEQAAQAPALAPEPTPRAGFSEDNPFGYNPQPVNEGENPEPVIRSLFDQPAAQPAAPVQNEAPSFAAQLQAQAAQNSQPETLEQLALFRKSSPQYLLSTPEFRVFYNMAIDDVIRRFGSESNSWEGWMEQFNLMKK